MNREQYLRKFGRTKMKITFSTLGILLLLPLSNVASAQTIPDLFMVPLVSLTSTGAAVMQPQTGDGYDALQQGQRNAVTGQLMPGNSGNSTTTYFSGTSTDTYLGTNTSPSGTSTGRSYVESGSQYDQSNYIPPQYDAFAEGSMSQTVKVPAASIKQLDNVDFRVSNDLPASSDPYSGTTKTVFTLTADVSSKTFRQGELEYRWDFQNDGQQDSYFSKLKSITHSYREPGEYEVKLEVLDGYGQVSSVIKKLTVVSNDAPNAYFRVDKIAAPVNAIFRFDTSFSSDNQYNKSQLSYRFDWDGDGNWDTNFQKKNIWNHLYREANTYNVLMEVRDPEGASSLAEISLSVLDDSSPTALLSVERVSDFNYRFDASQSTDDHTPSRNLKFRWDFNYSGSDDIIFDTGWNNSAKITGSYRIGGSKMIRLQVMDEQGLIDQTFAQIEVPWTEQYVNMAVQVLS